MPKNAGKRKRSTKPRLPSNPDDDAAMDRYHERMRKYYAEEAEAVAVKAAAVKAVSASAKFGGRGSTGAVDAGEKSGGVENLAAAVSQICQNIDDGFCPYVVENAYVFVSNPDPSQFHKKGKIRVLITLPNGRRRETEDSRKLRKLCGGDQAMFGDDDTNILLKFTEKKNCSTAIEPMIDLAVKDGLVEPGAAEADRLKEKYKVWFEGVGWAKTRISITNRPSSSSWNGFPWDSFNIVANRRCGLARGLGKEWKALEIVSDQEPKELVPKSMLPCFAKVWSREDGIEDNIAGALDKAMEACERVMKEN